MQKQSLSERRAPHRTVLFTRRLKTTDQLLPWTQGFSYTEDLNQKKRLLFESLNY